MADCLFCRIVKKQIPATVVEETDQTLAFRDINPRAPVHVLVIPKDHIPALMDFRPEHAAILMAVHQTIQKVAEKENVAHSGFRVVVNNGKDSGQAVAHVHYHVLGGRGLNWPPG
ncbi:MAG: histidine triad nucleotide-binding protein [Elusimicrobia bacterium RIFCSPLOWO2_01_FULL_59_12]|nr:MAG: histidine triad nucleotide-binding protein [Elusimicrobia bacterium RIFCSPLOWO2_01_FULL_59_12]